MLFILFVYLWDWQYWSIVSATTFAYATAFTTVFAQVTTSPEAKVHSFVVLPSSPVTRRLQRFVSISWVVEIMFVLGFWLTAIITESHSKNSSVSSKILVTILPSSWTTFSVFARRRTSSLISNGARNNSNLNLLNYHLLNRCSIP